MQPSPLLTCELLEGKQGLSWKEVTYLCLREERGTVAWKDLLL